ncbi:MAG: hypothetical protein AAFU85_29505, partial [Planctomycetota bacterium]
MKSPLVVAILLALLSQPSSAELIWIEGEDASTKTMRRHGWYDSVKKAELSGQEWLSHFGGNQSPTASFEFQVIEAGKHTLW